MGGHELDRMDGWRHVMFCWGGVVVGWGEKGAERRWNFFFLWGWQACWFFIFGSASVHQSFCGGPFFLYSFICLFYGLGAEPFLVLYIDFIYIK